MGRLYQKQLENKLRPLIFRNLLLKIFRKIKNALQPLIRRRSATPSPGGKAISKAKINFWTIVLQSVTKRAMPAPGGKAMK